MCQVRQRDVAMSNQNVKRSALCAARTWSESVWTAACVVIWFGSMCRGAGTLGSFIHGIRPASQNHHLFSHAVIVVVKTTDHLVNESLLLVAKISKVDDGNRQKHVSLKNTTSWKQSLCLVNAAFCRTLKSQGSINWVVCFHVVRELRQPDRLRPQSATKVDHTQAEWHANPPRSGRNE